MKRLCGVLCVMVLVLSAGAWTQPPQKPTPPAQEEFVPLSEIPAEEQIPAFTLVATAYAFVWVVLIAYVWSVARRLQKVETELATLSRERR